MGVLIAGRATQVDVKRDEILAYGGFGREEIRKVSASDHSRPDAPAVGDGHLVVVDQHFVDIEVLRDRKPAPPLVIAFYLI